MKNIAGSTNPTFNIIKHGMYKTSIREHLNFSSKHKIKDTEKSLSHAKILSNAHQQPTDNHELLLYKSQSVL